MPRSASTFEAFYIYSKGHVTYSYVYNKNNIKYEYAVYPTLFLNSSVVFESGNGSLNSPFLLLNN